MGGASLESIKIPLLSASELPVGPPALELKILVDFLEPNVIAPKPVLALEEEEEFPFGAEPSDEFGFADLLIIV